MFSWWLSSFLSYRVFRPIINRLANRGVGWAVGFRKFFLVLGVIALTLVLLYIGTLLLPLIALILVVLGIRAFIKFKR